MYKLSKNKSFKKNTIISISQEYLTKNLLDNFLSEEKYIIISHCPDNTMVYFNNKEVSIPNQFYIKTKEIAKNKRFTGLGDIFFLRNIVSAGKGPFILIPLFRSFLIAGYIIFFSSLILSFDSQ